MSKEDKYIKAVNDLLKDAHGSAEDMAELAIVFHKGIASLIMNIKDDHQEEMLVNVEPTVRFYLEKLKELQPQKAVFKA